MYHSSRMSQADRGHPTCVRHIAAISKAIKKKSHLTMGNQNIVHTYHDVKAFID